MVWRVGSPSRSRYRKGRGGRGLPFPVAVPDTGVPLILATTANAKYGVLGIELASDGQCAFSFVPSLIKKLTRVLDYIPCITLLNMTTALNKHSPIATYPLYLIFEPSDSTNA